MSADACSGIPSGLDAEQCDDFPLPGEPAPLVDIDVEAAVVRAIIAGLPGFSAARDVSHSGLRAIACAAEVLRQRGLPVDAVSALAASRTALDPSEGIRLWLAYELGCPQPHDHEHALEARRLAWWRAVRDGLVRGAIAAEQLDLDRVVRELDPVQGAVRRAVARRRAA